jgi:hypothetical protein
MTTQTDEKMKKAALANAAAMVRQKSYEAIIRLYKLRVGQGLTMDALIERTGKSQEWIEKKLSGPQTWSLKDLALFADALDGVVNIQASTVEW